MLSRVLLMEQASFLDSAVFDFGSFLTKRLMSMRRWRIAQTTTSGRQKPSRAWKITMFMTSGF